MNFPGVYDGVSVHSSSCYLACVCTWQIKMRRRPNLLSTWQTRGEQRLVKLQWKIWRVSPGESFQTQEVIFRIKAQQDALTTFTAHLKTCFTDCLHTPVCVGYGVCVACCDHGPLVSVVWLWRAICDMYVVSVYYHLDNSWKWVMLVKAAPFTVSLWQLINGDCPRHYKQTN